MSPKCIYKGISLIWTFDLLSTTFFKARKRLGIFWKVNWNSPQTGSFFCKMATDLPWQMRHKCAFVTNDIFWAFFGAHWAIKCENLPQTYNFTWFSILFLGAFLNYVDKMRYSAHCSLLKHYYSVDFPWWFDRKISLFSKTC